MTVDDGRDEFDVPLGGLLQSDRQVLGETHIEAAVAEVRFIASRTELPESEAVAVWHALGAETYPIFEKSALNSWNITVTPDGAGSSTTRQDGWVVASAARDLTVTLLPSMVIVQNSKYERFSTGLAEPLRRALEPFVTATGVGVINRIGLRYINRLSASEATTPRYWAEQVNPEFAGPMRGMMAPLVQSMHQQLQLRLDETAGARIQSGVFRETGSEERYSYLVDLDVYREQSIPFDANRCANLTRQLNRTALALFFRVLSPAFIEGLRPETAEEVQT